jgi:hypothetical protein
VGGREDSELVREDLESVGGNVSLSVPGDGEPEDITTGGITSGGIMSGGITSEGNETSEGILMLMVTSE